MKTSAINLLFMPLCLAVSCASPGVPPTGSPQTPLSEPSEGEKVIERYENGKREGTWTSYHFNGRKMEEGEYKSGKQEGLWTVWHFNGKKLAEGHYKNGKEEGFWTFWYDRTGTKKWEGNFENGKQEGVWVSWDMNGREGESSRWIKGVRQDG